MDNEFSLSAICVEGYFNLDWTQSKVLFSSHARTDTECHTLNTASHCCFMCLCISKQSEMDQ